MDADRLNEAEDLVERSELRDENKELRAEIERLRRALKQITNMDMSKADAERAALAALGWYEMKAWPEAPPIQEEP
jgi:predicted nuclease with TOPRIM domain